MNKEAINQKLKDIAKSGATKIALGGALFGSGVAVGVLGSELARERQKNNKTSQPSVVATPFTPIERQLASEVPHITEKPTYPKRGGHPINEPTDEYEMAAEINPYNIQRNVVVDDYWSRLKGDKRVRFAGPDDF